ncbi:MAG: pirin-like C-terminal cupin domain-containing protein [Crocinitomicaceae bacterium]
MVDIYAETAKTVDLRDKIKGEVAFVIVKGQITSQGQVVEAGQMLVSKTDQECEICMDSHTQILLFGGEPLEDDCYLLWNFVSHSRERLQTAKIDWINKQFPNVKGDETYIPFPNIKKKQ